MGKLTRRQFIAAAAGVAAAWVALDGKGERKMKEIALAALPYSEDALAPVISAQTVSFHYGKHHAGYVKTLNGLVAGTQYEGLSLDEMVRDAAERGDAAVFNNAAQAWNHAFYWNSLAPAGKGGAPSARLQAAIEAAFGSLAACKGALVDASVKRFGSGWAWLVVKKGEVAVESTSNAETPIVHQGVIPLAVVDVWEHAYYLDWQNRRADYAKAVVGGLLDWNAASRRFESA